MIQLHQLCTARILPRAYKNIYLAYRLIAVFVCIGEVTTDPQATSHGAGASVSSLDYIPISAANHRSSSIDPEWIANKQNIYSTTAAMLAYYSLAMAVDIYE